MWTSMVGTSRAILALLLVSLVAVACGGGGAEDETTADEPSPAGTVAEPADDGGQDQPEIVLGASLSLTGVLANEGALVLDGYEFIIDELNDRGGVEVGDETYRLRLVHYDDESDPETAARLTERLIVQDEVDFLLGPYSDRTANTATTVAEQYEVPIVIAHDPSNPTYERGYEYLFGVLPTIDQYLAGVVRAAAALEDGPQTVAVINEQGLAFELAAASAVAEAEELGLEVVYEAEYPQGATDLSAVLASVREADPDMLIASNFTSGTILTIRQMGELGLQPGLTAFILGPTLPGLSDDVGDAAEGLVEPVEWRATNPFVDEYLDWSAQDYADAFEAAYGYFPDHHPPQSSAAVMAYVHALGDAGSLDRVAVRDALSALDVMTFYGPIRFDENGQNVAKDLSIVQIQDGEPVVVYPPDVAEGELRYPGSG